MEGGLEYKEGVGNPDVRDETPLFASKLVPSVAEEGSCGSVANKGSDGIKLDDNDT